MSNRFFIIILVLIGIFFGAVTYTRQDKSGGDGDSSTNSVEASKHIKGAGSSGVTVVEFGDFQCPNCASFYPIIKELEKKYGDTVAFQFRNFPLPTHQNARVAHRAAEAASLQGKFFEMHDLLFENQQGWAQSTSPNVIFESFATQIGLDVERYKQDIGNSSINDVINADIKSGQDLGVTSTASFFIDGVKIEPKDFESFVKIIDEAIAKKATASS